MGIIEVLLCFLVFLGIELVYFKVAGHYSIIDHPNHRSSHTEVTIRGGGIIFSIALLLASVYFGYQFPFFLAGLFIISLISFVDDVKTVSNRIRITFHLFAVALLFHQLNLYNYPPYLIIVGFVLAIGVINAVNFMDGINGITGGYAMVTLLTLYFINKQLITYTDERYLIIAIISLTVFGLFNFRTKAKCFAGDVGSVSIAFIIIFFLIQLITKTKNLNYLLIILLYGLDTATTILFRIIRKENIFKAHRAHFYQYLVHHKKMPHLVVASLYMLLQGIGNVIMLTFRSRENFSTTAIVVILMLVFILIRVIVEGTHHLIRTPH